MGALIENLLLLIGVSKIILLITCMYNIIIEMNTVCKYLTSAQQVLLICVSC